MVIVKVGTVFMFDKNKSTLIAGKSLNTSSRYVSPLEWRRYCFLYSKSVERKHLDDQVVILTFNTMVVFKVDTYSSSMTKTTNQLL